MTEIDTSLDIYNLEADIPNCCGVFVVANGMFHRNLLQQFDKHRPTITSQGSSLALGC